MSKYVTYRHNTLGYFILVRYITVIITVRCEYPYLPRQERLTHMDLIQIQAKAYRWDGWLFGPILGLLLKWPSTLKQSPDD